MLYTQAGKELNAVVEKDVELIKSRLVNNYPAIKSIYVLGSFAVGEGTIIKVGDNYILNDYDFLAVFENYKPEGIRELERQLELEVTAPLVEISTSLENELVNRFGYNNQASFDAREAHKLVYGEDSLSSLPEFSAEGISQWSAIKLLLNRVRTIIEYSPVEDLESIKSMGAYQKVTMSYNLFKTYLSCIAAILIVERQYRATAEQIYQLFNNEYRDEYAGLIAERQTFIQNLQLSYEQKLYPDSAVYEKCANRQFLRQTISHLLNCFNVCLNKINKTSRSLEDNVRYFKSAFGIIRTLRMNKGNSSLKSQGSLKWLRLSRPAAYCYFHSMLNFLMFINTGCRNQSQLSRSVELLSKVYPLDFTGLRDLRRAYVDIAYNYKFSLPTPDRKVCV